MRNGYFEFDPIMFPRKLWVYVGKDIEGLKSVFKDFEEPDAEYNGFVCGEVTRKSDYEIGVVVVFPSRKDMTLKTMVHEASHIVDSIEDAIGAEHGGEWSAYLEGWVVGCLDLVKRGMCNNFKEIENKE